MNQKPTTSAPVDDSTADVYNHWEQSSDRLDYATYVRESGDWRDPGEIRMGA